MAKSIFARGMMLQRLSKWKQLKTYFEISHGFVIRKYEAIHSF